MTDPRRLMAINLICTAARDYQTQESISSEYFLLGMLDLAVETHLLSVKEGIHVLKWIKLGEKPELVFEEKENNDGSTES